MAIVLVCYCSDALVHWHRMIGKVRNRIEIQVESGWTGGWHRLGVVDCGHILSAISCSDIASIYFLRAHGNQLLIYHFHSIVLRFGVLVADAALSYRLLLLRGLQLRLGADSCHVLSRVVLCFSTFCRTLLYVMPSPIAMLGRGQCLQAAPVPVLQLYTWSSRRLTGIFLRW